MRVPVRVDNRIRLDLTHWVDDPAMEETAKLLKEDFTHKNPQREMLKRIGKPHWGEPKTIETWTETQQGGTWHVSFPRGGMPRVRARLEEAGHRRKVEDAREAGDPEGETMPDHRLSLYPYQERATQAAIASESGIIRAPTGSGKTSVGFALAARLKLCTLVIVYNSGLFDQWVKRTAKELGIGPNDIGIIRGGKRKLRPLTIAMQQTLNARGVDPEMARYFGLVIVDEVHRAAARTMFEAVDPFPARFRVGISADHRRKDGKEFLTRDLFGEVSDDIKRAALIKSGHVLDVQVRVIPTDFEADWYGLTSEENPDLELDTGRLMQEMTDDHARNELILSVTLEEAQDQQVLILSHRRDHCMLLDQRLVGLGVRTGFLIGGDDYRVEFRKSVQGVEAGTVRVGVGTFQAIGQGLDLPSVSVGVCATPIAANRQVFNQVRGRFCRTSAGKTTARLYYPWDRKVFGTKHLQNLVQWNADVVVRQEGTWVSAREYLQRTK